MKKIRFGDLVRNAGRPKTLTLWTTPDKNKELQQAIRSNRVLTVQRHNVGTKADVGEIGFRQQNEALYLVFPRRLPTAAREPVIGINYDLLEEPAPSNVIRLADLHPALVPSSKRPTSKPLASAEPPPRAPKPPPVSKPPLARKSPPPKPKPAPASRKFRVVVRVVTKIEVEVEARSKKEAQVRALQEAQKSPVPGSEWKRSVVRISERK